MFSVFSMVWYGKPGQDGMEGLLCFPLLFVPMLASYKDEDKMSSGMVVGMVWYIVLSHLGMVSYHTTIPP